MAADTGTHTPFMGSVTVTTTATKLRTLMAGVFSNLPAHACYVAIQLNTDAGGTALYIGNSTVTSTNCGVNLNATMAQFIYAFDSNLIALDDLWLLCSTGTVQANITIVVR